MSSKSPAKASRVKTRPDFSIEQMFDGSVCGLDEVGRGPLAGPVVAACVYIPPDIRSLDFIGGIRDSKTLSKPNLLQLDALIRGHCIYGIAEVSPQMIDTINILQASMLAMVNAYSMIAKIGFTCALIDGNRCPKLPCDTKAVVKGDNISTSIAAASIVAKVHHDRIMEELAGDYPHYGWESNVGYPAPAHLAAIEKHGVTPHHRRTYAPVRNFLQSAQMQGRRALAG